MRAEPVGSILAATVREPGISGPAAFGKRQKSGRVPGKAVIVKHILRVGVMTLLGVALAVSAASAIEYDDVIELAGKGVADRTIIELIVEDGRAFGMSEEEIQRLRDAGVSQLVIDVMLDPAVGTTWLEGESGAGTYGVEGGDAGGVAGGYSTSLDRDYGQGYGDGYEAGRSTALVYSFGYYYGPLARYYYCDPFYYPFYFSGYAGSYWPSYWAFYWRPSYSWCYAYPYNYYNYSSYYCHTYYDPGYWSYSGYAVQPGYGRTVWDGSPRWRNGGVAPKTGGRQERIVAGQFVSADRSPAGRISPPPIREALGARDQTSPRTRAYQAGIPGRAGSDVSPGRTSAGSITGSKRLGGGGDPITRGDRIARAEPGDTRSPATSPRIVKGRPTTRISPGSETGRAIRSTESAPRLKTPRSTTVRRGAPGQGGERHEPGGRIIRSGRSGSSYGSGSGRTSSTIRGRTGGSVRSGGPGRLSAPGSSAAPGRSVSSGRAASPGRAMSAGRSAGGGGGGGSRASASAGRSSDGGGGRGGGGHGGGARSGGGGGARGGGR